MADKSARIIANASNKQFETVNIVTSQPTNPMPLKKHQQATAVQTAASPHQIETYQDSGGSIKGLRTVHIPGYVGPD